MSIIRFKYIRILLVVLCIFIICFLININSAKRNDDHNISRRDDSHRAIIPEILDEVDQKVIDLSQGKKSIRLRILDYKGKFLKCHSLQMVYFVDDKIAEGSGTISFKMLKL